MTPKGSKPITADRTTAEPAVRYPLEFSIGAAVRRTHRSFTQQLETQLAPYRLQLGAWYFLRTLWEEDGLTQHELSLRVGTVDAAAVPQLRAMEAAGLVVRRRSDADRRKVHVFLTPAGRALRNGLEPIGFAINCHALRGLTDGEVGFLRLVLAQIRRNLAEPMTAATSQPGAPEATNRRGNGG